ncbi:MAG: branched-chain amino acid ABC transporter permease [Rhodospirillum sp.]|nr:branched-chain amino acid ABC transporter permease [Rhodospirillum sp.]MCF8488936.1 branched-chain amino acid ABC transporter permease [Rhodospirillum sp.]MCF8498992.1 branched-chain amino acid ABC transporter permease [Rhodospirillum sp.]
MLVVEQILNGLQLGVMLFLMSAGLTLVFGIMGLINLAHGSFYMVGAYVAAWVTGLTGSLFLGLLAALPAAMVVGMGIEVLVMRRLYTRDHLDQVLATFGLILFFNEMARILFGRQPLFLDVPEMLSGTIEILPGVPYPAYRLAIIAVGILVAIALWLLISRTRLGMRIRAGASDREMAAALGANVTGLQTLVFGLGALLAGLAGAMAGPILAVESGMGEKVLILAFVVIVIGGIGSVRGALVAALTVGLVDTLGRAFLPDLLRMVTRDATADSLGANLSQISIYLLMALVLAWKPKGLFPSHG